MDGAMKTHEKVNILLVDDQPAKLLSYQAILEELGENLITANSAREAFEQLLKLDVAVILTDVCMPELDGFQLATMLREHPRFESTAIIFVSAILMSEPDLVRGYETGAVDYVSVPIIPEILRASSNGSISSWSSGWPSARPSSRRRRGNSTRASSAFASPARPQGSVPTI
jgi:CheY-like chemotaxis protein